MEALGHGSSPGNCWQAAHRSSLTAKSPAPLPDKKVEERLISHLTKSNPIRMEELLAGLGLGSGTSALGVSNLMNLVMQFRKVRK